MISRLKLGAFAVALAFAPTAALAHTGGDVHGFMRGAMHPVSGLDHVLAMVAVGLFAATLGGRALWLVPAAFVAMMGVGGLIGIYGLDLPYVELGIAASVIILGAAVAFRFNAPTAAAMGLAGFFALFHGHAHGVEMPVDAAGLAYALGFMLATALLHATGIGLAVATGRLTRRADLLLRAGGGVRLWPGRHSGRHYLSRLKPLLVLAKQESAVLVEANRSSLPVRRRGHRGFRR
jgi:urease accessory protein